MELSGAEAWTARISSVYSAPLERVGNSWWWLLELVCRCGADGEERLLESTEAIPEPVQELERLQYEVARRTRDRHLRCGAT